MQKKQFYFLFLLTVFLTGIFSCQKDHDVQKEDDPENPVPQKEGIYILNEGAFGSSNASLDFYDSEDQTFHADVFNKANPEIVKGLGDVGNDAGIYGSKIYLVVNNSNKIEVADAITVKSIKTIDLPLGRHIAFYGGKAFITSTNGFVAVIDTASLEIEKEIEVGRNPDGLAVSGHKLYVANSGGYSAPDYDNTLSVIDLNTMKETQKIPVAINLEAVVPAENGDLYVTSQGNFIDIPADLYIIDTQTDKVKKDMKMGAGKLAVYGNFIYGYQYSYLDNSSSYFKIDTQTEEVSALYPEQESLSEIAVPYGIAVDPANGDLFITDAKDYQSPGSLYCFSSSGDLKWEETTGILPTKIIFLP